MIEKLFLKLSRRDEIPESEAQVLRDCMSEVRTANAGETLIHAGDLLSTSTVLLEGLVGRVKDLTDGRRQIIELHVPGDFFDLHAFLLRKLEHDVEALTPVRVVTMHHERLREITERCPHLARLLWKSTLLDAAIQREKILSIGRRSAIGRLAHLLCELHVRFGVVEMTDGDSYALELTQAQLADIAGLTQVHVNRTLKELRDRGVVTFRSGRVTIGDWRTLTQVAEFTDDYLYLERRPV
ncbi:MAG TPA: Crp/Fnr family transcriptional regulator [Sphingomonadaceae bacterium]|nr:Crp/Fnr family transcriptional regulator [Sphingomonadaceae bacterium]